MGSELTDIAIIGMAGRFPKARDIAELWRNLCEGRESITHFSVEDLEIADARTIAQQSNYVRVRSIMSDVDKFDASFFGILPREAELIDPQHRVFLECCWQAFEDAGYDPLTYEGIAALYAGCSPATYFLRSICNQPDFIARYTSGYQTDNLYAMLGSSSDFLPTRVAYKLNLRGPAFAVMCGCSTSLVAVSQACMSLQNYQCDLALAGGVSITFPQKRGYLYEQGGMGSPDGHCRTFDANAQGTVFGDGAAVVLLKRLSDALADRDNIYAVIKGFGVTNDGTDRVGFTAPAVEGQARAIAMAHASGGIDPSTITYVEAHGTATPLGDPIEIAALTKAFRLHTQAKQFCAIGSTKSALGHLDAAAGVTGLIKTALSLKYRLLPPSLNFEKPNPALNLEDSPFYVNTRLTEWQSTGEPLRAGVSSFGMGGTNAHVVLEQAPSVGSGPAASGPRLILLSARSDEALSESAKNLADFLQADRSVDLADVAYTTIVGRHSFDTRRAFVVNDADHAIELLRRAAADKSAAQVTRGKAPGVVFMFPGQGAQYAGMGRALYKNSALFRGHVDRALEVFAQSTSLDLRGILFPASDDDAAAATISNTEYAQPALFVIEYALAQMWIDLGIEPSAMIGHSIGEFVAACIAGVMSLDDAARIVAERGRLMQSMPAGAMTAVRLPEAQLTELAKGDISIAAINAPALGVLAGPFEAIEALERQLESEKVIYRRLRTSHAFHSTMMEPAVGPFAELVRTVDLKPPTIPFISSVTGRWISDEEAVSPEYWARHLRSTVRFSEGVAELRNSDWILLEVGPGGTLTTLARQHPGRHPAQLIQTSFPERGTDGAKEDSILEALGQLWMRGVMPKWPSLFDGEERRRVALPTYPFERKRFWIDPQLATSASSATTAVIEGSGPAASDTSEVVFSHNRLEASDAPSTGLAADISRGAEATSMASAQADTRASRIRPALESIFQDLSGMDISGAGEDVSFLEMGFDSLFLTQVSQAIQTKFGIKITFRQLLDQVSTLTALVAHLDKMLPPEALPAPAAAAPAPTPAIAVATPAPAIVPGVPATGASINASSAGFEDLFKRQLQAMSDLIAQQMSMLRGGVATPANAVPAAAIAKEATPVASPTTRPEAPKNGPQPRKFIPFRPVAGQGKEEMTTAQMENLRVLTERYNQKTQGSKRLTQENRAHLADPRVAAGFRTEWKELVYPIATVRSKGSRLWDVDGNEYIDVVNGYGPIMFGHAPDFVVEAIEEQLKIGFETGPQSPLACEVAKTIAEMTGTERVSFCNTGSEAVVAALRVARTVTARNKVVIFAGAYHGMFDEVVVKAVPGPDGPRSLPVAPGIPREKVENVVVLDYGTDEALSYIENHAKELAAVLVEPVQSRHPGLQPVEFLKKLRRITEESGTALIFDEIVTGFRVHPGGCQALFGIKADVATYGKVLAGGLPMGIVAGKAAFMDALDGGMWRYGDDSYPEAGVTFFAGTFVRHPLALAATKAVLNHLQQAGPQLYEDLGSKTAGMAAELNAFLEERQVPSHVDSFGSVAYFTFPTELKFTSLFYYYMRLRGIYIQEGFPVFLTTAHTASDIAHIVAAFKESILEMQAAGFLPGKTDNAVSTATGASYANGLSHAEVATPAKPAVPSTTRAPLTESQIEIWLSAGLGDEQNCCYNESFTLKLTGELDRSALQHALDAIVARHEALRTKFGPNAEYQEFVGDLKIALVDVDISSADEATKSAQLAAILDSDARKPFDLVNGPLVRLQLVKLRPDEHHLIVTTHHIACDGWSTNVILDELSQLYSGYHVGKPVELPAPIGFGTYARTQAEHFEGESGATAEKYWLEQYQQLPPPLDLPIDRPRPPIKSHEGATRRRTIPVESYRAIKAAAARQKCTLFVMLLAGFEAALSRLSGQDDIVVGIPSAGQSLLEDEILVGHCVNFLPLRGRLTGDPTMTDFLAQTRKTLLDAYDHQNYTYGRLVRKLSIRRDPSRLPLLEVQFNLERVGGRMDFAGLKTEVDPNAKAFVNHDLFLNVIESDQGLTLDCDYNTRLLDAGTVDRWLGHFQTLLEAAAQDPNRPVSRLPLLSSDERSHLLEDWNQTAAVYPHDRCINQLFEEHVERTPDAVAVVFEDQSLTYRELDRRANQLAVYLRKSGVGPGTLIGVFIDRSLEMMIALMGVLKAGAAYVPMDPTYPAERIAHVLDDAKLPILLTQENLVTNLPIGSATIIKLDTDWSTITATVNGAVPPASAGPDDLAYVIYTSGSTGKPKGVEIPHRAVVNLLTAMAKCPGLTAADTLLAVTTLSFDIAGLELYLPLCVGAKVVIASREDAADGARLLTRLASSEATVIQATPITFRLLIEAGWNNSRPLKVLCGGEALPRDLANAIAERASELWNMYGPTETTIWSSTVRIVASEGPVVIGPPIANTQFHVVDTNGELAPFGRPGELLIGGDGLARGYFNRPELTAEKFIRNPFSTDPKSRLYRTGDLVKRLGDGTFEFLGRLDNQVKLRGYRIELGEIEAVLSRYPAVREAVVALREDIPGEKRLVAYVVTEQQALAITAVREFLTGKLPNYMLPTALVRMTAMPLTPNGKVDRKALPAPDTSSNQRSTEYVAPQTDEERKLAAIWAEVLRVERVGVQDNLFELGADSLHIFQIAARAEKVGIKLAPIQFLKYRTIAALLEQAPTAGPTMPPITRVSRAKYRVERPSF